MRPRIVFLDLGLSDTTGYQVGLEATERDYRDEMTLVALTGRGMAKDRERSHNAGFEYHLTKPVSGRIVPGLVGRSPPRATQPEGELGPTIRTPRHGERAASVAS